MNQSRRSGKMYLLLAFAICSMAISVVTSAQVTPGPIPQTLFGMHTNSIGDWPKVPFGAFRLWDVGVNWYKLCPTSSTCDFAPLDAALAKAQAAGVPEVLYTFGHTPTWASSNPTSTLCGAVDLGGCFPPPDLNSDGTGTDQTYKDFVTAIANHAGSQIKYWEVWNEPTTANQWQGTTAQLVRMSQDASAIIKAANPNALILTPPPVGGAAANWMSGYLAAGGGKYVDIISYHTYVDPSMGAVQVVTTAANVHAAMAKYGQQSKPLWSSEGSWGQDSNLATEALQADFLAQFYILHWSSGVQRLYWYSWDNSEYGTLWDSTNGMHPAATAYTQVQNWLVGATMPESCSVSSSTYTCPLTRSGAYQAQIVFNPNSTLTYTAPSQYIQYHDILGNTHTVPANGQITIGPSPIMLETNTPGTSNTTPLAELSVTPTTGTAPLAVSASSAGSSDPNGSITSTSINFGDGSAAVSGATAAHTYTSAGTFAVTLTVTGTGGTTSSATQTVTVSAPTPAPVAVLSVAPKTGTAPLPVTATSSSTGSITSQTINFGDGSATVSGTSAAYTYTTAGTYTVTLTATGTGGTTSATQTVTVSAPTPAPVAVLSVTPKTGTAPLPVTATSSSTGSITSQTINFGDGSATVSGTTAAHTYKAAGTYTITLTVTGSGGTTSATQTITASAPAPVAVLSVTPKTGIAPLPATATSSSTGSITSQTINFGDGSATVSGTSAAHTYKAAGTYTVTLTVKNASGTSSTATQTVVVSAPKPVAVLTVTPISGTSSITAGSTSYETGGSIASQMIFWGDETAVATTASATHTYKKAGQYTVKLEVKDAGGNVATTYKAVTVSASKVVTVSSPIQ